MILKKEPALIAGLITAGVALALVYGVVDERQAGAWELFLLALLPVLQGLFTRSQVFSENTVREAGLTPEELKERANDPTIPPARDNTP